MQFELALYLFNAEVSTESGDGRVVANAAFAELRIHVFSKFVPFRRLPQSLHEFSELVRGLLEERTCTQG